MDAVARTTALGRPSAIVTSSRAAWPASSSAPAAIATSTWAASSRARPKRSTV
jgi:hypothetical protein